MTITKNLEETQKMAADFVLSLKPKKDMATVIGLHGDLGTGKTSFTQGLAKALGVENNVVSPTFVIEKIYELKKSKFLRLIHIDAYRLDKPEELLYLGWKDIISDNNNLVLIEWPERVAGIMPDHVKVNFAHISENEREIEIVV